MFVITPYQGVSPIEFGMSADELLQAVGQPVRVRKNLFGEADYTFSGFSVRLSTNNQTVVEVGLGPTSEVRLDNIDIFNSPSAFEDLIKKDGNPLESMGFIILLNLGITMTGFHDADPSQLAVTAFAQGRWDDLAPKLEKYVHLQAE